LCPLVLTGNRNTRVMYPQASQTINGILDQQYPENEMVLGVYVGDEVKAYPLRESKKAGGIVEEEVGRKMITIFTGPRPEQATMAAYDRNINGQTLSFQTDGKYFIDNQTQSKWTIEGHAIEGHYMGQSLLPITSFYLRWHAWVYVHKSRQLFIHTNALPLYPALPYPGLDVTPFKPVLDGLASLNRTMTVEMAIPESALPHQVQQGLTIRINNDRINLYLFSDIRAAIDYINFEGAWHYNTIIPRLGRKKAVRINQFILESDPDVQYEDSTQVSRLPDNQIKWSTLVTDPDSVSRWSRDIPVNDAFTSGYFSELISLLKKRRYDVIDVGFLPQCQLYVGVLNGISATIEGYRYSIYRCIDQTKAEQLASRFKHSLNMGELVLISLPEKMHIFLRHESGLEHDDNINWPNLLDDKKFLKTLENFPADL